MGSSNVGTWRNLETEMEERASCSFSYVFLALKTSE